MNSCWTYASMHAKSYSMKHSCAIRICIKLKLGLQNTCVYARHIFCAVMPQSIYMHDNTQNYPGPREVTSTGQ